MKVCELYIDNSIFYKKKTGNAIESALHCASTSTSTVISNESASVQTNDSLINVGNSSGMSGGRKAATPSIEIDSICTHTAGRLNAPLRFNSSGTANDSAAPSIETDSTTHFAIADDNAFDMDLFDANIAHSLIGAGSSGPSNAANDFGGQKTAAAVNTTDDNADVEDATLASQLSVASKISTQNFLSQMQKQFAFYKCEHLTINIGKK